MLLVLINGSKKLIKYVDIFYPVVMLEVQDFDLDGSQ